MRVRIETKPENGPSSRIPLSVETREECGSPWVFAIWVASGAILLFIIFALCAYLLKGNA